MREAAVPQEGKRALRSGEATTLVQREERRSFVHMNAESRVGPNGRRCVGATPCSGGY